MSANKLAHGIDCSTEQAPAVGAEHFQSIEDLSVQRQPQFESLEQHNILLVQHQTALIAKKGLMLNKLRQQSPQNAPGQQQTSFSLQAGGSLLSCGSNPMNVSYQRQVARDVQVLHTPAGDQESYSESSSDQGRGKKSSGRLRKRRASSNRREVIKIEPKAGFSEVKN